MQAVGSAGNGSAVTIRSLEFRRPFANGDLDGDCIINSNDARVVLLSLVDRATLTDEQKASADINGDGKIDPADVRAILQKGVDL